MKKKFYDVVPKEQKTIRNVPLNTVRASIKEEILYTPVRKRISDSVRRSPVPTYDPLVEHEDSFEEWEQKRGFRYIWIIAFILIASLVYVACIWFSSATITVKPVRHPISLTDTKIALSDIDSKLVEIEVEEMVSTTTGGLQDMSVVSKGTIVLYNSHSTTAVTLPTGTRLVGSNSRIYKTTKTVTVPGYSTKQGKIIPGSIEVVVEGEKPGKEYDTRHSDFYIENFKGTAKYMKVYGRSKNEVTGGMLGKVPNIKKENIESLISDVKNKIASTSYALLVKKTENVSKEYVYINDLVYTIFENPVEKISEDGKTMSVSIKALSLYVFLNSHEVSKKISEEQLTSMRNLGGRVQWDIDTAPLKASMQHDVTLDALRKKLIYLFFNGETNARSRVEASSIASAVSGLTKEQAKKVIRDLVESEYVDVKNYPWWIGRLPLSKAKIKVISE